ncbi:histidine kinase [Parabacteroides sp. OttesenSCG-928-N08]|nr:histidine kinase [Parabacteroides sp. OttesenSCG-928-N08]
MNGFIEFQTVSFLLFALLYTLAFLPGLLRIPSWIKAELVFILSFGFMLLSSNREAISPSYYGAVGALFLCYNGYLFLHNMLIRCHYILRILIDFLYGYATLIGIGCLFLWMEELPITNTILERFDDGSYTFTPGYLQNLLYFGFFASLLLVNFTYIHRHLMNRWEKQQAIKLNRVKGEKIEIETQFEALQAKVNPHFLYNSLNSIAGLATVDPEKTRRMALALSRFFRYNMNRDQQIMITAAEEAEMIATYLEIEKIRFGERLHYRIDLPDNAAHHNIPRMLLQPLVENCIKHGMRGGDEPLQVTLLFNIDNRGLRIELKDNGIPFPQDFRVGYGIKSVYDKLDLLLPGKYRVEIDNGADKCVIIELYS